MEIVGKHGPLFDPTAPTVRLVWDASTLGALMRNPYTYYWNYVLNRRMPSSTKMFVFGHLWHELAANYWQARDGGFDIREAWGAIPKETLDALEPQGPYSAFALLRMLAWYTRWRAGRPVSFDRTLGVERSFAVTVPDLLSPGGYPYILAGSVDQVVEREGGIWFVERKSGAALPTPASTVKRYRFQTDVYQLFGALEYKEDFRGIVIDAAQTAVTFSDFDEFLLPYDGHNFDPQHTWDTIKWRIEFAERLARFAEWKLAARLDDPYAPKAVSEIMAVNPNLWDTLMKASTDPVEPWYPGGK